MPYSRGFYIGGQNGDIYQYESSPDENIVYEQVGVISFEDREKFKDLQIPSAAVSQMAMTELEDTLIFVDRSNQLVKCNLQQERTENRTSEYLFSPFHHEPIIGMDICLRKQLIVTCSASCIMLWNYGEKRFLMAHALSPSEVASDVAFHPSGFHILACVGDKLLLFNVLSNRINEY